MAEDVNPLVDDSLVDFLLFDVVDVGSLTTLSAFADHERETFELYLASSRRLARQALFPTYRAMDEEPPVFEAGRVHVHPRMRELWSAMVELGVIAAMRPVDVGGQQLPHTVSLAANGYLMAGNLSAYGYAGLTTGAAHLIEAFGDETLRETYMARMYAGEWTGTMALTEPHAGSSLGDLSSTATPRDDGSYRIRGAKIFISGGDQDFTDNVVHLLLARIDGAPAGTRGISLFVVPSKRPEGDRLVANDVHVTGVIHKIGWKGLPSLALGFGDEGDCRGWLVGEPHQGLRYMFQMMNEARLMVGLNAVATASAAYHEAKMYAKSRRQGRALAAPAGPEQVPLVSHPDVRRMLLRQKSIVEGGLGLVLLAARYQDLASHAEDDAGRARAKAILDLLTPVVKSYPAEKGFEANALAVQVLGGYGYTSEYLPEAFLRDQKLNTIHEGTTGIQSLDLLGRKVVAKGGESLRLFAEDVGQAIHAAREAGLEEEANALEAATSTVTTLTMELGQRGLAGDVDGMLGHSADYLELFGTWVVGWVWVRMATVAQTLLAKGDGRASFLRGVRHAGLYFVRTELPRIAHLSDRCRSAERSYLDMDPDWF